MPAMTRRSKTTAMGYYSMCSCVQKNILYNPIAVGVITCKYGQLNVLNLYQTWSISKPDAGQITRMPDCTAQNRTPGNPRYSRYSKNTKMDEQTTSKIPWQNILRREQTNIPNVK